MFPGGGGAIINFNEMPLIGLIISILAILTVFYSIKIRNNNRSKNKSVFLNKGYFDRQTINLRNEYIRLHGDTRMAAAEVLDRQIDVLKRKHPNKDMSWYIEKAILDLKRDRQIT